MVGALKLSQNAKILPVMISFRHTLAQAVPFVSRGFARSRR
jgi:hypothetical protein